MTCAEQGLVPRAVLCWSSVLSSLLGSSTSPGDVCGSLQENHGKRQSPAMAVSVIGSSFPLVAPLPRGSSASLAVPQPQHGSWDFQEHLRRALESPNPSRNSCPGP